MVSRKVTWGLLAAWVVHDIEELATMSAWTRRTPVVPKLSHSHSAVAIGLVGLLMAAASADGARTGGRSGFFQSALIGFGLHSITHVAASAALRGYTPGLLTAPTVVAPFSLWAWRELRRAGVPTSGNRRSAALWFPVVVLASHGIARLVTPVVGDDTATVPMSAQ